jgi:Holliday junction resolvase RusA-like endonuclease
MVIVVPGLCLPSWNEFYSGVHWHKRRFIAEEIHWQVAAAVPGDAEPFAGPVNICVTAYRKRVIDADNVAAKLVIDGLCQAGLLEDDSPAWVESVTTRSRKGEPRVEIKIVEAG